MPSSTPSSPCRRIPTPAHPNAHARVAALLLAQLKTADPASWSPPWHGANPLPTNALTQRRYTGLNILVLWAAAQANGYTDARWATYRQWAALGTQVRKGERGTPILFCRDLAPADGTSPPRDTAADAPRFVARTSTVFNRAQVDGVPNLAMPDSGILTTEPLSVLDAFAAATKAVIIGGGTRACYVPATDTIYLPPRAAFCSADGYAATLTHELVHWTGAPHRLARDLTGRLDRHAYAAEELVAEIGAAFVLADLGLARHPHPDHAAYCAHWLPLLRAEPRALAIAASHASRAASYLVALQSTAGPNAPREPWLPDPEKGPTAPSLSFVQAAA